MELSRLQLKNSDLLIFSNMLLLGLRLLVEATMILYVCGSIKLVYKFEGVRVNIYIGAYS